MTPYGILAKDDVFAFEKSLLFRQKKIGELKTSYLMRIIALMCIITAPVFAAVGFILKDKTYIFYFLIQCAASAWSVYNVIKIDTVTKPKAVAAAGNRFQIVLYEDRLIYGTEYSRGEYYYDEIICCREENGILTLIINEDFAPVSVNSACVLKGDYSVFCGILHSKLRERFIIGGGRI